MSSEPQQVHIVIAHHKPLIRHAVRRLLEKSRKARFKIVGETSDGAEAVTLVRQLKPDILLLGLVIPEHSELRALRELRAQDNASPVRVILLTEAAEKSQAVAPLQLGARGVVVIYSARQFLRKAIQAVMAGEYWVGKESFSNLVQYLRTLMESSQDEAQQKFSLYSRHLDIVSAAVEGYTIREMVDYFQLHELAVRHCFIRACETLGVPCDRLDVSTGRKLARVAIDHKLPLRKMPARKGKP